MRCTLPLLAVATAIALVACGSKSTPVAGTPTRKATPADPWLLICNDPAAETPALLWNGKIGLRIGRDARAAGPMFRIDEYEVTGEEKIKPLQNPVSAVVDQGSNDLATSGDPSWQTISDYSQVLDMRTGLLTTKWTQPIPTSTYPKRNVSVTCETILHPTKRIVAQRWTLVPNNGSIEAHVEPAITSGAKLTGTEAPWRVEQHGSDLVWTFAESPNAATMIAVRTGPETTSSREPLSVRTTFDGVFQDAKQIWAKRWQTDIEIEGPLEDQQALHSFLFYLRSAIDPNGKMSISPYGLSNSQYNGHVFWDADIWIFPALALIDPAVAKAIPEYRLATRMGAIDNAINANIPDKPHITEYEPWLLKSDYPKYAWESSVTGRETAPISMRAEEHINGDVPWMITQAAALGMIPQAKAQQALQDARKYWIRRSESEGDFAAPASQQPPAGKTRESRVIRRVTSPDESHTGDNDLYTNLLAQWCVDDGSWNEDNQHSKMVSVWPAPITFRLPHDTVSFLSYDGDQFRGYKQAAAVLSIFPLQYPPAEKEANVMMDRFADKVIKNGPAMTDSLHALIWARLGETGKAYETWERSWRDFVKEPHLQFSEKRNKASTYFTTGAAGCLQTVIYGFLGFRIDSKKQDGAQWSVRLPLGQILSVKPNLPQSWKSVKFRNFAVLGKRYTLTATHSGVRVTQGDQ